MYWRRFQFTVERAFPLAIEVVSSIDKDRHRVTDFLRSTPQRRDCKSCVTEANVDYVVPQPEAPGATWHSQLG